MELETTHGKLQGTPQEIAAFLKEQEQNDTRNKETNPSKRREQRVETKRATRTGWWNKAKVAAKNLLSTPPTPPTTREEPRTTNQEIVTDNQELAQEPERDGEREEETISTHQPTSNSPAEQTITLPEGITTRHYKILSELNKKSQKYHEIGETLGLTRYQVQYAIGNYLKEHNLTRSWSGQTAFVTKKGKQVLAEIEKNPSSLVKLPEDEETAYKEEAESEPTTPASSKIEVPEKMSPRHWTILEELNKESQTYEEIADKTNYSRGQIKNANLYLKEHDLTNSWPGRTPYITKKGQRLLEQQQHPQREGGRDQERGGGEEEEEQEATQLRPTPEKHPRSRKQQTSHPDTNNFKKQVKRAIRESKEGLLLKEICEELGVSTWYNKRIKKILKYAHNYRKAGNRYIHQSTHKHVLRDRANKGIRKKNSPLTDEDYAKCEEVVNQHPEGINLRGICEEAGIKYQGRNTTAIKEHLLRAGYPKKGFDFHPKKEEGLTDESEGFRKRAEAYVNEHPGCSLQEICAGIGVAYTGNKRSPVKEHLEREGYPVVSWNYYPVGYAFGEEEDEDDGDGSDSRPAKVVVTQQRKREDSSSAEVDEDGWLIPSLQSQKRTYVDRRVIQLLNNNPSLSFEAAKKTASKEWWAHQRETGVVKSKPSDDAKTQKTSDWPVIRPVSEDSQTDLQTLVLHKMYNSPSKLGYFDLKSVCQHAGGGWTGYEWVEFVSNFMKYQAAIVKYWGKSGRWKHEKQGGYDVLVYYK